MLLVQLGDTTHVVRAGENIFEIALQYGITVDSLARANGITNSTLIYVGQKLKIPQGEDQEMEVVSNTNSISDRIHVIQPGENLFRVALKYNVDYYYLARYNNISNPASIYVGQEIKIPQQ
jgi:LysM repeat protein